MKKRILLDQAPLLFGRPTPLSNTAFTNFSFLGFGKGKKFLETLQGKLKDLDCPVTVVKDDTEANLDIIASHHYDFVLCVPGLQKKMFSKVELPLIFFWILWIITAHKSLP